MSMSMGLGGVVGTGNPPKIDSEASLGLSATVNSIGYRLAEIENHIHSPTEVYGLTTGDMTRKSPTAIIVTGGSGAWGTEIVIAHGAVIGGGSATKKFDIHRLHVGVVGNASRHTILEFFAWGPGVPKAAALVTATDKVTDATNTVANNDKVVFPSIASNTGVDINTVYYVINRAAGDFEVSLTRAGAKVDVAGADGACTYLSLGASDASGYSAGQPVISEVNVSKLTTTADLIYVPIQMARVACNSRISCRAWGVGGTNAVNFWAALHTYLA